MTLGSFGLHDEREHGVAHLERIPERRIRLAQREDTRGAAGEIHEHLVAADARDGALHGLAGTERPEGLLLALDLRQELRHRLGTGAVALGGIVDHLVALRAEPHRHTRAGGI